MSPTIQNESSSGGLGLNLSQLLSEMLPILPPESLRDYIFVVILIPLIFRLLLLIGPYKRFKQIIPNERKKAISLLYRLEIPRLRQFVNQQIMLIFLPALISLPVLYYFGLNRLTWSNMPADVASIGALVLGFWIIVEFQYALMMNTTFHKLLTLVEKFMGKMSDLIPEQIKFDGSDFSIILLEHAVKVRQGLNIAGDLARKAELKLDEENIFPFLGKLGEEISTILRAMIQGPWDFGVRMVEQVVESSTNQINSQLDNLFPMEVSTQKQMAFSVFRSAFPSLWLAFLIHYNQIGV